MQARHQAWLEEAGAMTHALTRQAHQRATDQLADTEPAPATAKDESTRFTRLVRCLRQTIAAEARAVAPHAAPRTPRPIRATHLLRAADPRLILLRRTLHDAVRNDPDRGPLCRTIDAEILDLRRTDPAGTTPIQHILVAIAKKFDIPLDITKIPDALLGDPKDDPPDDPPGDPPDDPSDDHPGTTDPPH